MRWAKAECLGFAPSESRLTSWSKSGITVRGYPRRRSRASSNHFLRPSPWVKEPGLGWIQSRASFENIVGIYVLNLSGETHAFRFDCLSNSAPTQPKARGALSDLPCNT